jgi:hypothetical protein
MKFHPLPCWAALPLACWLVSCDSPPPVAESVTPPAEVPAETAAAALPIECFNGEDLSGWGFFLKEEGVGMADVWSVQDGLLVCKGEPMGYLHTTAEYTNFDLTVEWRWAPGAEPGNSGILMRINGDPKPLPRCLEVQLKSGSAGDVFGFHGMPLQGEESRMRHVEAHELGGKLTGSSRNGGIESEPGEWNRMDVSLQEGLLVVKLNGVEVNRVEGCEVIAGPIALQSEGGEIHFRRVSLTPR